MLKKFMEFCIFCMLGSILFTSGNLHQKIFVVMLLVMIFYMPTIALANSISYTLLKTIIMML